MNLALTTAMLIIVAAVATSSSAAANRVIPENNQPTAVEEEEKEESRMKADEEEKLVYRVFRIFVRTWEDVNAVAELRAIAQENPEIDFWLDSVHPGHFADVMVSPNGMQIFQHFLDAHPLLDVQITVDDVQNLIYRNEFRPRIERIRCQRIRLGGGAAERRRNRLMMKAFRRSRSNDQAMKGAAAGSNTQFDQLRGVNYPFGEYTGYNAMIRYLRTLEFYYPHLVQLIQIGATHEGRSIEGVKVGLNPELSPSGIPRVPRRKPKRAFWIDGNMHAREWASGHTALFIINQMVASYGRDPFLTNALNRIDFYIVPCANPDGFEFSRSSMNPKIRLWRKNRSPEQCTRTWSGLLCCRGVDLNRNFDFHWAETGSSMNACSNLFAGKRAFSEPEARAIADFLQSDELRGRVDAFITLHTYAQMWIHPYSHEYQFYPPDVQKLKSLALRATARLKEIYGTTYRVGTGADLLAPASGGSDDWAKERLGVKFVYLVELRPQLDLSNGFILRQEELLPTAIETFEAIKEVIKAVLLENALPTGLSPLFNATNANNTINEGGGTFGQSTTAASQTPNFVSISGLTTNSNRFHTNQTTQIPSATTFAATSSTSTGSTNLMTESSKANATTTTITTQMPTFTINQTLSMATPVPVHSPMSPNSATTTQHSLAPTPPKTTTIPTTSLSLLSQTAKMTTVEQQKIDASTKENHQMTTTETEPPATAAVEKEMVTITQRIFTLPWVPTRRVSHQTFISSSRRIQATSALSSSSKQTSITTTGQPSTTVLYTIVQEEATASEIVLPTQIVPSPNVRTAPTLIESDSFVNGGEFSLYKREKSGKFIALENAENLLIQLLVETPTTTTVDMPPTRSTTATMPFSIRQRKCSDEKSSCAFWIRAHPPVCAEQRRFMQRNCAFSCGFCKNI